MKWWITINEPKNVIQGYGHTDSDHVIVAPMISQPGVADYLAAHTLLRAHAKAYHLYTTEFKPSHGGLYVLCVLLSLVVRKSVQLGSKQGCSKTKDRDLQNLKNMPLRSVWQVGVLPFLKILLPKK